MAVTDPGRAEAPVRSDAARLVPVRPGDPGLQAQRTALAWNRTALALCVNALLVLRIGIDRHHRPTLALGVALLLATSAVLVGSVWRRRQLDGSVVQAAPSAWLVAAITLGTLLACATGLLVTLHGGRL